MSGCLGKVRVPAASQSPLRVGHHIPAVCGASMRTCQGNHRSSAGPQVGCCRAGCSATNIGVVDVHSTYTRTWESLYQSSTASSRGRTRSSCQRQEMSAGVCRRSKWAHDLEGMLRMWFRWLAASVSSALQVELQEGEADGLEEGPSHRQ